MDALRRLVAFYRIQWSLLWGWRPGRVALIRRGVISFVVAFVALLLTVYVLPGIRATNVGAVAVAVVVLALLNALVRPVILAPLAALSLWSIGVGAIVFQVVAILLLGSLVPGLQVDDIATAVAGAWLYAILNTVLGSILSIDRDVSYFGALIRQLAAQRYRRPAGAMPSGPGLVIVQIDGLAWSVLAHQVRAGRVPVMASWLAHGTMRLDRWTVLLPTQTSASQAGILHGNNAFIPAFRWWDRSSGRLRVSNVPADAADIVRRASNGQGLLSVDGASIGNLCSGDAARAYLTMATLRDPAQGFGHSTSYFSFFLSPNNFARMVIISLGEVVKELYQAWRQRRTRTYPTMHRGGPYPFLRAVTNVVLRQVSTSLVVEEMFRGTPVIYVDLTDYDEIAHHSGPERPEALDALDGVDSVLGTIELAATDAPRPYRFVVLSDHGQSLGATFRQRYGVTLEALISELMGGAEAVVAATSRVEEWAAANAFLSEASKTGGATGAMARTALRNRQPEGSRRPPDGVRERDSAEPLPELVVCASGNLGLIYFARSSERLSLEGIDDAYPGLVDALANHPGIGLVMVRTEDRGTIVVGRGGLRHLADDQVDGDDPTRPFGVHAVTGLRRVDAMVDCGDLVVISRLDPGLDSVAAFEELIGSHGGLGGAQTEGFILHPADWVIDQPLVGAESVYRQLRRWLADLGIDVGGRPAA